MLPLIRRILSPCLLSLRIRRRGWMALVAAGGFASGGFAADSPPPCRPLPEGVVAWYPGEDIGNVLDLGVGTPIGNVQFVPGYRGLAFSFDGLNDAVSVPGSTDLNVQDLTVECWMRRGDTLRVGNESAAVLMSGNAGGWVFGISVEGSLFLGKLGVINSVGRPVIVDNRWHHVAVTRGGAQVRFYVDGVPAGEPTLNESFEPSLTYGIGGLSQPFNAITYGFLGLIDDMTVYRRVLTSVEIAAQASDAASARCLEDLQIHGVRVPTRVLQGQEFSVEAEVHNRSVRTAAAVKVRIETAAGTDLLGIDVSQGSLLGNQVALLGDLTSGSTARVIVRWRASADVTGWITNRLILDPNPVDQVAINNELMVVPLVTGSCIPVLSSTAAWWPAEGNARDAISGVVGGVAPTVQYVAGRIGSAFAFRQNMDVVTVPLKNIPRSQEFTVEGWIRRSSAEAVSPTPNHSFFLGGPEGSMGFGLVPDGRLYLHKIPVDSAFSTRPILDTRWHHVAVTRSGADTRFYIDGVLSGVTAYTSVFVPGREVTIGGLGSAFGNNSYTFLGDIDELVVHSRSLSAEEMAVLSDPASPGRCVRDLNLVASGIPGTVATDDAFNLEFLAQQLGSLTSGESRFILVLPPGVEFISVSSGQGVATETAGVVRCDLGSLGPGASVPITIRIRVRSPRILSFEARLQSPDPDLTDINNAALFRVSVVDFQLSMDAVQVDEGPEGTNATVRFEVRLNPVRTEPLTLAYTTESGTAVAGRDFVGTSGTLVIPVGVAQTSIGVSILGDNSHENTEEFQFTVTTVSPGPLRSVSAAGMIRNDDLPPVLRVLPGRWLESGPGMHRESFVAELIGPTELPAIFRWTTSAVEARENVDFLPASGAGEFLPGETRIELPFDIIGDNVFEGDETLLLRLSGFSGCRPAAEAVRGIIVDDDPPANVPARFTVETGGSPLEPGRPFSVTLTALNAAGEVLTGFDGAVSIVARGGSGVPSRVVISEVAVANPNDGGFVELVNVGTDDVDVSGWRILLFEPSTWPDPVVVVTIPDALKLARGQSLLLHQHGRSYEGAINVAPTGAYFNWFERLDTDLFGTPLIGVLVQDSGGATEDSFLAGRADPSFMVSGAGVSEVRWQGPAVPVSTDRPYFFQRVGHTNSRSAADWVAPRSVSPGLATSDLALPFADAVPVLVSPDSARGFTQGRWMGVLVFPDPVLRTALYIDDGNGHTGRSAFLTTVSDLDKDGIPDAWEIETGLSFRDPADALRDLDGDGFTALEEWVAGTDPRIRSSALHLRIQRGRIEWSPVAGRRYRLEQRDRLSEGQWALRKVWDPASDDMISEDLGTDPASEQLFRVVVEQIPPG